MALLSGGCFSNQFPESEPRLSTDAGASGITVEAESSDPNGLTATLTIRANQSWGANVVDDAGEEVDWITLSAYDHLNLSGTSDDTTLEIGVGNNRINRPRNALLRITSANCETSVEIRQKAAVYFLEVEGAATRNIDCGATTVPLSIRCNTRWNAVIKEGATASVSLDVSSGEGDGELSVSFGANEDTKDEKTASIILSAEDCDDIEIQFIQSRSTPYITILTEETVAALGPKSTTARLRFDTNTDWNAAFKGTPTLKNAVLEQTSGTKEEQFVDISFEQSLSPEKKQATVILSAEGVEPQEFTFEQTGMVLRLSFAAQPFTEKLPTSSSGTIQATTYDFVQEGASYPFEPHSSTLF